MPDSPVLWPLACQPGQAGTGEDKAERKRLLNPCAGPSDDQRCRQRLHRCGKGRITAAGRIYKLGECG